MAGWEAFPWTGWKHTRTLDLPTTKEMYSIDRADLQEQLQKNMWCVAAKELAGEFTFEKFTPVTSGAVLMPLASRSRKTAA